MKESITEFDMMLKITGGTRMKHLTCGYEGPIEEFRGKRRGVTTQCPKCRGITMFQVLDPDQEQLERLFGGKRSHEG